MIANEIQVLLTNLIINYQIIINKLIDKLPDRLITQTKITPYDG